MCNSLQIFLWRRRNVKDIQVGENPGHFGQAFFWCDPSVEQAMAIDSVEVKEVQDGVARTTRGCTAAST